ncbi:heterogeneous nuclear ribonucleoprotein L-like isoform X1 [Acanthaster planci]|uniref:Heterogeneous nuclear ribonucleoprotein L-like isoform X1 n=1 Tax=Acanthaster planci TaxID=133434 RepID=A0A8B7Y9C1_ACAPL|nr:heterogeneous nuclear ribonucleoprotein L-like isoform X1 [Acanthaster planci]
MEAMEHSCYDCQIVCRASVHYSNEYCSSCTYSCAVCDADRFEDDHKHMASKVVHVRGLSDRVSDGDLVEALQFFGPISYVYMMTGKGQALVEFEDIEAASACVDYTQNHPENVINVAGSPAVISFSNSKRIKRPGENAPDMPEEVPNRVILLTVHNPFYSITTEVIHTICKGFGEVLRIVIFRKNGIQSMVEFDTIESATKAKKGLQGCDIYSGCCTLRVEFARTQTLTVYKNDHETYDYTNASLAPSSRGNALLDDPPPSTYNGPTKANSRRGGGGGGGNPRFDSRGGPMGGGGSGPMRGPPPPQHYQEPHQGYGPPHGGGGGSGGGGRGGYQDHGDYPQQYSHMQDQQGLQPLPPNAPSHSGIVMVYNIDLEKMNCEKLFNILCPFGNVYKVKFMKSKPGTVLVDLGDAFAVSRAITNLSNIEFFGMTIQLGYSNQTFLNPPPGTWNLPDGSPSYMDFSKNRNNRFMNKEAAAKNRLQRPSHVLHFYNAHPESTAETIKQIFINAGAAEPIAIKMFESKSERSVTGLVEWENRATAMEAMILANHTNMDNPGGKYPYTFKLCFSNAPHAT